MTEFTDCLVLKIEEYDIDTNALDTTLYVLYDKKEHHFIVRGQRFSKTIESCVYSFKCEFAHELEDFLSFVVCKKNHWTYTLYNYDNLPSTSDEISYDFLQRNDSKVYELAAYDYQKFNKKQLLKNLRILRSVFNNYN
jgi:hypothetical protein